MDIKKIKRTIPYGGIKEISKRSKLHYITVVAFFNGNRQVAKRTETKILKNTAKYLQELNAKNTTAKKNLEETLKA